MKRPMKMTLFLALALALAVLIGSCGNYRYYNRYPKPKRCGGCPSFSHMMETPRLT
jgi:hypothetical protein